MENKKKLYITVVFIIITLCFIFYLVKYTEILNIKTKEEIQEEIIEFIVNNDVEELNTLLDKRADIDFVTDDGYSPLQIALKNQSINSAISLIEHGAKIEDDSIPLIVQTVMILNSYNQYQGSEHYEDEMQPILQLIKKAHEKNPKEINITDKDGYTALHYAASRGIPEVVELLLELGADPNIQNNSQLTPLKLSVINGHNEVTTILLKTTNDLGLLEKNGNTLLISAAMNGYVELINILIDQDKINIDEKNHEGKTALMYAAEYGYTDVVKVLLENGADMDLQSSEEKTALQYATDWGHEEIIKLLQ